MSIEYCYRARDIDINGARDVFNLLAADRNGLQFTITDNIIIQTTPQNSICTNPPGGIQQICCDTTPLSGLQIPSSEHTFGIVITNVDTLPLGFLHSVMDYRVEQFQISLGSNGPSSGSTVTLTEGNILTDRALLLIRFNIMGM